MVRFILYALFRDLRHADSLRPNNAIRAFQLAQYLVWICTEVCLYDDSGFRVPFCLRDWTTGEYGDLGNGGRVQHVVEDGRADEASRAGEDKVHLE